MASNAASPKRDTAVLFLIRFARISQTSCFHFLLAFVSIFGASFCKHKLSGCSHEFSEILGDKDQDHTKYMYIYIYIYIHIQKKCFKSDMCCNNHSLETLRIMLFSRCSRCFCCKPQSWNVSLLQVFWAVRSCTML